MAAKTKYVGVLAAGALVAVVLLVLMMLMVGGRPAEATFPGKNGRITYVGSTDRAEIYTINPDGSDKFRVTNTKNTWEEMPEYSPDGKKIAYTGHGQGVPPAAIYTISVRGEGKSKVTGGADPSYSPDGKQIVYSALDGHDWEIYTMNVGGGSSFQVTNNNRHDFAPAYSPDGKRIAYEVSGLGYEHEDIYTINATGGKPINLTNSGGFDEGWPSYSPNGKKIAYSRGVSGNGGLGEPNSYEIYTINATGGTPYQLTHNKMGDFGPSYSPNGKKIAYSGRPAPAPNGDFEIYTINAGGGGRVQVTNNRRTDDVQPSWGSRP